MALVFDIETIGTPYADLPPSVQEYLVRPAAGEAEEEEKLKRTTSLLPYTGGVACIAMRSTGSGTGRVLFRPGSQSAPREEGVEYVAFEDEKMLLEQFWRLAAGFSRSRSGDSLPFVTFNGRGFDVPYLVVRSGILEVKVTCDLLGNRYRTDVHVDLYDQLAFQGAANRRFNLDLVCRAFGIESPKSEEAHGYKVQEMWEAGRGADIARYCYGDVVATAELYRRWKEFMSA